MVIVFQRLGYLPVKEEMRFRDPSFTQIFDSVAQLVELPAFNRKVVGSSPTGVTNGESSSSPKEL